MIDIHDNSQLSTEANKLKSNVKLVCLLKCSLTKTQDSVAAHNFVKNFDVSEY